jgi:hypothetical protein
MDAIVTTSRVLTRRRIDQLRTVGLFPVQPMRRRLHHVGPLTPLDRLLDENVEPSPDLIIGVDAVRADVDSPWGSVMVYIEPLWRVTESTLGWKVWEDWGSPFDASDLTNQQWATEDLARRYLEVLTDNFWAKVTR